VDVVPNTIGKPYVDALKSPYLPTQDDYKNENYVSGGPDLFSGYKVDLSDKNATSSGNASGGSSGGANSANQAGKATLALGGKNVVADVLDKDVCAVTNPVTSALDTFEKVNSNQNNNQSSGGSSSGQKVDSNVPSDGKGNPPPATTQTEDKNTTQENLAPAPKDNWADAWCPEDPSVPTGGDSYGGLGTTFGDSGFTSLGDVGNSLLNNSSSTLTGAGVGFSSKVFSAQASVCVTIKLIKKTLLSYYPGKSCVLCEVKKINEIMKKTLSHSLVPNKVTGNLMESAKCKSAIGGSLFDMKFVVIKAPIPTPSGGDVILGKNIFESWKKFIDRYQPLLFNYLQTDSVSKFQLENAPSAATQEKLFSDIQSELSVATAEAKKDLSDIETSESATNTALYTQALIKELDFMTQTFQNYKDLLEKTNNVCQEWGKKPTIQ